MTEVFTRAQIERLIDPPSVVAAMEAAFAAYSRGEAVVPPVGQLDFVDPPGDCHVKYGYLKHGTTFTVKIATGFWKNPERGLASSNGVVLVFSSQTGELETIFQDQGFLTDIRTAAAGAVAAKHLAPREIRCIGIIGAGLQARLQLEYLKQATPCRRVKLWARSPERAGALAAAARDFDIDVVSSPAEAAAGAQLIVTTTASRQWLLGADAVQPGTHVTAVGADGGGKQELDPKLFARAAVRAVDSLAQCSQYGDSAFALAQGTIVPEDLVELGAIIQDPALGRRSERDITIADLTGVAVQDMAIAELTLQAARGAARSTP